MAGWRRCATGAYRLGMWIYSDVRGYPADVFVGQIALARKERILSITLAFSRLVSTADGGSRFEALEIPVVLKDFAPPAQPFSVSSLSPATQTGFLHLPPGWIGEMHPSPIRMWIFVVEGQMHFEASNGEARQIAPGSALLLEDTVGRGHFSRVLGQQPVTLAVVRLPEA